jgi:hypothetical protein
LRGDQTYAEAGGAWEFVESLDVTGNPSTVDLAENNIDSGYDYLIDCIRGNISADQTIDNGIVLQFGTGGTPTYQTSSYLSSMISMRVATITNTATGTDGIYCIGGNSLGSAGAENFGFEIFIPEAATATRHLCRSHGWGLHEVAGALMSIGGGQRTANDAITGFRFTMASGTWDNGLFAVFKRKRSA